jgi:hypothetical protein
MTQIDYIFQHLLPTWLNTWRHNFKMWADLMTNNYEIYANPWCDSPEKECYEWFWASINLDDTFSKEFLEDLQNTIDLIDSGKIKLLPFNIENLDYDS